MTDGRACNSDPKNAQYLGLVGQQRQKKGMPKKATRSKKRTIAIPRATFERLIKEISQELKADGMDKVLWSGEAVDCLHEETETFLTEKFQAAKYLCDTFEDRTLSMKHFQTAKNLGGLGA